VQVSIDGGAEPLWSPQGAKLFYRSTDRQIVAARLETDPLRVAQWDTLFVDRFARSLGSSRNWSVYPSGREFLLIGGRKMGSDVKVVVNWPQLPAMQRQGQSR
jgi:hypothetical protein